MKKITSIIIGISLLFSVVPFVSFAQSADSQSILTSLLQQLLVLYTQELTSLEQQLATLQANQTAMQNQLNNAPSSSQGMIGTADSIVLSTSTPTSTDTITPTSTYAPSQTLSQIQSVAPQVVATDTVATTEALIGPSVPTITVTTNPDFNPQTLSRINDNNSELASFIIDSSSSFSAALSFDIAIPTVSLYNVSTNINGVKQGYEIDPQIYPIVIRQSPSITNYDNYDALVNINQGENEVDIFGTINSTGTYPSMITLLPINCPTSKIDPQFCKQNGNGNPQDWITYQLTNSSIAGPDITVQ